MLKAVQFLFNRIVILLFPSLLIVSGIDQEIMSFPGEKEKTKGWKKLKNGEINRKPWLVVQRLLRFPFAVRISPCKMSWRIRSFKKVNMCSWVVWTRKSQETSCSDIQFNRTFEPCFVVMSVETQKYLLSSESASTESRTLSRNVSLLESLSVFQTSLPLRIPMQRLNVKRF